MYQELSAKIDNIAYNTAVNITMSLFPNCKELSAWDPANGEKYQKCTNQIGRSNSKIQESTRNVEFFIVNRTEIMSLQTELEQILEGIELDMRAENGLDHTLAYIKNSSSTPTQSLSCPETERNL